MRAVHGGFYHSATGGRAIFTLFQICLGTCHIFLHFLRLLEHGLHIAASGVAIALR